MLLAANDVAGATAAADEAISIVGRIRAKSANPEWRARFLSSRYSPYEARIAADFAGGGDGAVWQCVPHRRRGARPFARGPAGVIGRGDAQRIRRRKTLRAQPHLLQLRLEARIQRQDADEAGHGGVAPRDRGTARAARCALAPPWPRENTDAAGFAGESSGRLPRRHGGARLFRR